MRVFVTGATGFVGSAVVQELLRKGHQVLGLARSEASAASLIKAGAAVHHGTLDDLASVQSGAAAADAVIHCGFNHDFSKFKESCEHDGRVIEALGQTLSGSQRPLLITSGIGLLPGGRLVTEDQVPPAESPVPRVVTERAATALMERGLHVALLRLPPSVHGAGDHGFVPMLIQMAREKGTSAYIGEGQNRWPAVHRLDAARLYVAALAKGKPGARYHAVGDTGVPFKEIATMIGRHLQLPVVSKTPADAERHFTWFTHFAGMDVPASSQWTQKTLDWQAREPGLIADMEARYFQA